MDPTKKKILMIVAISVGVGAVTGVSGYFLGLDSAVNGGVTGALCGTIAVFLHRSSR